jgi:hypothetical protein
MRGPQAVRRSAAAGRRRRARVFMVVSWSE